MIFEVQNKKQRVDEFFADDVMVLKKPVGEEGNFDLEDEDEEENKSKSIQNGEGNHGARHFLCEPESDED